jgi:hypothetical protein
MLRTLIREAIQPLFDDGWRRDFLAAALSITKPTLLALMREAT